MKKYLVDVPVKINIWIRPRCQEKQFEVIKQARPSILFLVSDGGRNEEEWKLIERNRALYETIDWECTIYKLYEEENQGMYAMSSKSRDLIWSKVDRCIFLEDDVIPSVSFFRYCKEMLERYKDDMRISVIDGMNPLGVYDEVNADYFFSHVGGSIWGFATWKRVMDEFGDFEYAHDSYVLAELLRSSKSIPGFDKQIKSYINGDLINNHPAGCEYYLAIARYLQNQMHIIPKKNMICNIGYGDDAAHATEYKLIPKRIRQLYNMDTYELEFPLKHAKYMIDDREFGKMKSRMLGEGNLLIFLCSKAEHLFNIVRYRRFDKIANRLCRIVKRERRIER